MKIFFSVICPFQCVEDIKLLIAQEKLPVSTSDGSVCHGSEKVFPKNHIRDKNPAEHFITRAEQQLI